MKLHNKWKYLLSSFIIVACCLQQYCRGQSTTVRPYKFGFTIDEQQHHERGIVMGEFGFITADGIYHVTVYATDEQGRFRILAMKNYPYESPPKTVEVMVKPKIPPKVTTSPKPLTKHNFNTQACSGCFLTNGNNKPKDANGVVGKTAKNDIRPLSKALPNPSSSSAAKPPVANKVPSTANSAAQENTLSKTPLKNSSERSVGRSLNTELLSQKKTNLSQHSSKTTANNSPTDYSISKTVHKTYTTNPAVSKGLNQKTANSATQGSSQSSLLPKTSTGNQPPIVDIIMQKVLPAIMGKDTRTSSTQTTTINNKSNAVPSGHKPKSSNAGFDNNKKSASGSNGSSAANGYGDLYRFKYNLDYHGHTETGKRNGNKEGSYYAIGDDNVERTIEYVANEFGYQPRIRWRKLNINEIKSKENTLKDYEFVWFK